MMGRAEKTWLVLLGLTLTGALFAETGHASWFLALVVAGLIALKSRLVADYYMELRQARPRIRRAVYLFITLVPLLVVVSHGWSELIRRITTIG